MPLLTIRAPGRPPWQHAQQRTPCEALSYTPPTNLDEMLVLVRGEYERMVAAGIRGSDNDSYSLERCLADLNDPGTLFTFDPDFDPPQPVFDFEIPPPNWKPGPVEG